VEALENRDLPAPLAWAEGAALPTLRAGLALVQNAATGNPKPTVQWQVSTDGGLTYTNISGATSTKLSLVVSASDNDDIYRAVFTNTIGTAMTTAATLTV
jgi:hypothetical protein